MHRRSTLLLIFLATAAYAAALGCDPVPLRDKPGVSQTFGDDIVALDPYALELLAALEIPGVIDGTAATAAVVERYAEMRPRAVFAVVGRTEPQLVRAVQPHAGSVVALPCCGLAETRTALRMIGDTLAVSDTADALIAEHDQRIGAATARGLARGRELVLVDLRASSDPPSQPGEGPHHVNPDLLALASLSGGHAVAYDPGRHPDATDIAVLFLDPGAPQTPPLGYFATPPTALCALPLLPGPLTGLQTASALEELAACLGP